MPNILTNVFGSRNERVLKQLSKIVARINALEGEFAKVTPALLQDTAREYLRRGNRTVYVITPGAAPGGESGQ